MEIAVSSFSQLNEGVGVPSALQVNKILSPSRVVVELGCCVICGETRSKVKKRDND